MRASETIINRNFARRFFSASLVFFLLSFSSSDIFQSFPAVAQTELVEHLRNPLEEISKLELFVQEVVPETYQRSIPISSYQIQACSILDEVRLKYYSSKFIALKADLDSSLIRIYHFSNYFPAHNS